MTKTNSEEARAAVSPDELQWAQAFGWKAVREKRSLYLWARVLPDGRWLGLMPLFGGNVRLGLGPRDADGFDQVWDFTSDQPDGVDHGWRAAIAWDGKGDPEGWYRHHPTGRRRPDGTAASERVGDD
jgi:hypothetical protein